MNKRNAVGEGAGLVLTRKVGERIIISADPKASDAELLETIREGIVVTMVDVTQTRRAPAPSRGNERDTNGRPASADDKSMHGAQRGFVAGRGTGRIGFKAGRAISITREEILPQAAQANG